MRVFAAKKADECGQRATTVGLNVCRWPSVNKRNKWAVPSMKMLRTAINLSLISANRISVEWKKREREKEKKKKKRNGKKGSAWVVRAHEQEVSDTQARAAVGQTVGKRTRRWEGANGTKEEKQKANLMNTGKWTNGERKTNGRLGPEKPPTSGRLSGSFHHFQTANVTLPTAQNDSTSSHRQPVLPLQLLCFQCHPTQRNILARLSANFCFAFSIGRHFASSGGDSIRKWPLGWLNFLLLKKKRQEHGRWWPAPRLMVM